MYSPTPASRAFTAFARDMLEAAFSPRDPQYAQFELPVEAYAAVLAELKPRFIHAPECKRLLPRMLEELACDPAETYFDVPRMRSATSHDYLTTGIAYAFHPHRDTWYSAPMCQVNWWMPIYPIAPDNCMAFHPRYWSKAVQNSSAGYNYQEWNRSSRFAAAAQIGVDNRPQPRAIEPIDPDPQLRLLPEPGGAILFSAAQLHSTVPNTSGRTRYSIDFRTVNADDAIHLRGAANLDSSCTGTTMGDYLRSTDLSPLPDEATASYDDGPPQKIRA